jgi:hypothetical protein
MSFNIISYIDQNIWWIIPTNSHYGILKEGQQVTSIHIFEVFNNEEDWIERLSELDIEIVDEINI